MRMKRKAIMERVKSWICQFPSIPHVYFGRHLSNVPENSIIFFPYHDRIFCCGIAGIVSFKKKEKSEKSIDINGLNDILKMIEDRCFTDCKGNGLGFEDHYLGGKDLVGTFFREVKALKRNEHFYHFFVSKESRNQLAYMADRLFSVSDPGPDVAIALADVVRSLLNRTDLLHRLQDVANAPAEYIVAVDL